MTSHIFHLLNLAAKDTLFEKKPGAEKKREIIGIVLF